MANEPKVKSRKPRGRPVKNVMPEPIPDTPENVARACMQGPPMKDWLRQCCRTTNVKYGSRDLILSEQPQLLSYATRLAIRRNSDSPACKGRGLVRRQVLIPQPLPARRLGHVSHLVCCVLGPVVVPS